ncbi:helix-turn-helix domain-containing protein [Pseudohongiella sp.]|uniref:helix-turn-helix domain-containing protein n=1 Tax=Pseudohongiella sp. TaxID=1979412 RepID=UPI0025D96DCF|nr:helix-turn-helix transcriptional regulator [Pseudohongiella sp.]
MRARLAVFIREARGDVPQRVFARKMGVAQSTIMRIENEDQNVTLDTLEQLCKAFHVDVGELFPVTRGMRVYPPSARVSAMPASTMIHDSAAQNGKSGKSGK